MYNRAMSDPQPDVQTSPISQFYNEQCVFVTGATGFMGRILIEKLLRCSLQLRTLYVLVRAQRGKSAEERMAEILQDKVFDKLRGVQPDFSHRIIVCEGDVMKTNMGLSDSNMEILTKNVTVVFHCAATIKFDDPLKVSVKLNVGGVQHMIAVCHALQNLKALVHVSTAFSNCDRSQIDEAVYPPSLPPNKLMEALDWMDDELVETLTPKLIGRRPNTYTYTKSLAEYVLVQEGKGLPLAIFRPSIVGAVWKEPTPGWVSNTNGPTGLFIAVGKGFMRVMRVNMDTVADIVPVDIAINMMIAVGWYTATARPSQCLVYHCTTGGQNPCTWKEIAPIVLNTFHQYPYDQIMRRPRFHSFTNTYAWFYWRFVNHVLPAYVIDFFSRLSGKRPVMVRALGKLDKAILSLDFFTQRMWQWSSTNGDRLMSKLSPRDKELYDFDVRNIDWKIYYENFALGTKQFILQEDMSNVGLARKQITKFQNIRYTFNALMVLIASHCLIKYSSMARAMWFSLLQFCFNLLGRLGLMSML